MKTVFLRKNFYHKRPYIENDYFCYVSTDLTDSNAKFYRIPLNNLSRSAVEEFNPRKNRLGDTRYRKIYLDENNKYFFVTEDDGNIGNNGIHINRLDETFIYQNHEYDVTLYLGDGEYLASGFSIWSAFKEPATDDPNSYRNANFVKNLVPQNEDRQNYSPILSPDKGEIFFLSKSRASSQEEPTLYKVSRKGGEPEVVAQKFKPLPPLNSDLKWSDSVFLDWIE